MSKDMTFAEKLISDCRKCSNDMERHPVCVACVDKLFKEYSASECDRARVEVLREAKEHGYLEPKCIPEIAIDNLIAKYSPAPSYCDGMRDAMKKGLIEKWFSGHVFIGGTENAKIVRCPFCPEGKDCLKDKA